MKTKIIIAFLLAIGFIFLGLWFTIKQKDRQIDKLTVENFTLNTKLQGQVKIVNGKVQIIYRDKIVEKTITNNVEKIIEKKVYLPPENKNTVIAVDKDGKIDIKYDSWGTTFYPFVGLSYSGRFSPELGARLFYLGRWGTGLSASTHNIRWFIDYRPDIDWLKNTSLGVFVGNDKETGLVVHTFF